MVTVRLWRRLLKGMNECAIGGYGVGKSHAMKAKCSLYGLALRGESKQVKTVWLLLHEDGTQRGIEILFKPHTNTASRALMLFRKYMAPGQWQFLHNFPRIPVPPSPQSPRPG